jgi:hypothetical protein
MEVLQDALESGETPLALATIASPAWIAEIQHQEDPQNRVQYVQDMIRLGIENDQVKPVRELLRLGADGEGVLGTAMQVGTPDMVRMLVTECPEQALVEASHSVFQGTSRENVQALVAALGAWPPGWNPVDALKEIVAVTAGDDRNQTALIHALLDVPGLPLADLMPVFGAIDVRDLAPAAVDKLVELLAYAGCLRNALALMNAERRDWADAMPRAVHLLLMADAELAAMFEGTVARVLSE